MLKVQTVKADITKFHADAIVNAANSSLLGGSGVDGAIHRAAGKELLFACMLLGGCKTGQAKKTKSFKMSSADFIIHTVGPVYKGLPPETAEKLLIDCYRNSLDLAKDLTSIAFPAISTGIYGYPLPLATQVAVDTINQWATENPTSSLQLVTLIAFSDSELETMRPIVK